MNTQRRKTLARITAELESSAAALEEVMDDEREAYDNMPEGLQETERGQRLDQNADELEDVIDILREAVDAIIKSGRPETMANTPADNGARAARGETGTKLTEADVELILAALRTHRRELEWLAGKCRAVGNEFGAEALLEDAAAVMDLIEKIGS